MLRISNVRKYLWIVSNFSCTLLLVCQHWWRSCIDIDVGLNRRPTQYNAKKIIAHVPTPLKINPHYFATQLMFTKFPWAPPQACASGHLRPLWKCCKVFYALVVTVKRSVDQLFMHYFHNFSSASGSITPISPPRLHPWTALADFRLQTP